MVRGLGKTFAGSIAGKEIVNIDGTVLGELEDFVFDLQTGTLIDMVAKPNSGLDARNTVKTANLCSFLSVQWLPSRTSSL